MLRVGLGIICYCTRNGLFFTAIRVSCNTAGPVAVGVVYV